MRLFSILWFVQFCFVYIHSSLVTGRSISRSAPCLFFSPFLWTQCCGNIIKSNQINNFIFLLALVLAVCLFFTLARTVILSSHLKIWPGKSILQQIEIKRELIDETKLGEEKSLRAHQNGHYENMLRRCWICWRADVRCNGTQMSRHPNYRRRFERGTHPPMEFR